MRNNRKNNVKILLGAVVLYLLFRTKWYSTSFRTSVSENPHQVWEFVSDLSNARLLNPSIYDFDILHEKGNYEHWEFTAVIYETMSFIPMLTNVNYANYILKPSTSKDHFKILSNYQTCFFKYACLYSKSEMTFTPDELHGGTEFQEVIDYQCPLALNWLCSAEVDHQRNEWMSRLKKQFWFKNQYQSEIIFQNKIRYYLY